LNEREIPELQTSLILKPESGSNPKSQTRPKPDIYFWSPI